jgi:hypothetical protein
MYRCRPDFPAIPNKWICIALVYLLFYTCLQESSSELLIKN